MQQAYWLEKSTLGRYFLASGGFRCVPFSLRFPKGPLLGVFCSEDDASWGWTSNLPYITHLVRCPNQNRPTISSD